MNKTALALLSLVLLTTTPLASEVTEYHQPNDNGTCFVSNGDGTFTIPDVRTQGLKEKCRVLVERGYTDKAIWIPIEHYMWIRW